MGEPAAMVVIAAAEVLPLLTGRWAPPPGVLAVLAAPGWRVRAVLAAGPDEWLPVAELEADPGPAGWRVAAVACDGPRHPGLPRFRAVFARMRAFTRAPDAVCAACAGSGWLPPGDAAKGVVLRAAGFRLWRGVALPAADPRLQLAAQRDMLDLFLSMGSPPPSPTERPPGARAGNGLGATFSTTEPTPPAAPEAPAAGPGPGAATSGEEA